MKRTTELKRTTPLKASRSLARSTPLQPKTPLARAAAPLKRAPMVQKRVKPKLTVKQKSRLELRSGGICELRTGMCTYFAVDPCHRINEGMGGRHGQAAVENDQLSAVLHGCRECHDFTHRYPKTAERNGWRLRTGFDPRRERVNYRGHWVLLSDDGRVTPA